jgi:hypothetical protein
MNKITPLCLMEFLQMHARMRNNVYAALAWFGRCPMFMILLFQTLVVTRCLVMSKEHAQQQ